MDFSSLYDLDNLILNKELDVQQATEQKVNQLKMFSDAKRIKEIHDGDTLTFEGEQETTRSLGYDTAEVLENGAEDFINPRKLNLDRASIASNTGQTAEDISNADINAKGVEARRKFKDLLGFTGDNNAYAFVEETQVESAIPGDNRHMRKIYNLQGTSAAEVFNNPIDNMRYNKPENLQRRVEDAEYNKQISLQDYEDWSKRGGVYSNGVNEQTGEPELQPQPDGGYSYAGYHDVTASELKKFGALMDAQHIAKKSSWTDGAWYKEGPLRLITGAGSLALDQYETYVVNHVTEGFQTLGDKVAFYNKGNKKFTEGAEIPASDIYRFNDLKGKAKSKLTAEERSFMESSTAQVIQSKIDDIHHENVNYKRLQNWRKKLNSVTNRVSEEAFNIDMEDLFEKKDYHGMFTHALLRAPYVKAAAESMAFSAAMSNPYTTVPAMMGLVTNKISANEREFYQQHGRKMNAEEAMQNQAMSSISAIAEKFGADYIFKGVPGADKWLTAYLKRLPKSLEVISKPFEVALFEGSQGLVSGYADQKALGEVDTFDTIQSGIMEAVGGMGQVGAVGAARMPGRSKDALLHGVHPDKIDDYTAKAKHWSNLQSKENLTDKQKEQLDKRMSKLEKNLLKARTKTLKVKSDVSLDKIDDTLKKYFPDVDTDAHTQELKDKIAAKKAKREGGAKATEARKEELKESIQTRKAENKEATTETKEETPQENEDEMSGLLSELTKWTDTFKKHAMDPVTGEALSNTEGTNRNNQGLATVMLSQSLAKATYTRAGLIKKGNLTADEEAFIKSVDKLVAPFKEGALNKVLTASHKNLGGESSTEEFLYSVDPALLSMDDLIALGKEETVAEKSGNTQQIKQVKQKVKLAKINKELKQLNKTPSSQTGTKAVGSKKIADVANDVLGEEAGSLKHYVSQASENPESFLQTYGASFLGFVEQRKVKAKQFKEWFDESFKSKSTIYFKNENGKQVRLKESDIPRDKNGKLILGEDIKFIDYRSGKLVRQLQLEADQADITHGIIKDTLEARGIQMKEVKDTAKALSDIKEAVDGHVGFGTIEEIGGTKKEKKKEEKKKESETPTSPPTPEKNSTAKTLHDALPAWANKLISKPQLVLHLHDKWLKREDQIRSFLAPFRSTLFFLAPDDKLQEVVDNAYVYNEETETWEMDPKKVINALLYLVLDWKFRDVDLTDAQRSAFLNKARPALANSIHNVTTAVYSLLSTEGTPAQQKLLDSLIEDEYGEKGKGWIKLAEAVEELYPEDSFTQDGKWAADGIIKTAFWMLNRNKAYTAGELNTVIQVAGQRRESKKKKKETTSTVTPPTEEKKKSVFDLAKALLNIASRSKKEKAQKDNANRVTFQKITAKVVARLGLDPKKVKVNFINNPFTGIGRETPTIAKALPAKDQLSIKMSYDAATLTRFLHHYLTTGTSGTSNQTYEDGSTTKVEMQFPEATDDQSGARDAFIEGVFLHEVMHGAVDNEGKTYAEVEDEVNSLVNDFLNEGFVPDALLEKAGPSTDVSEDTVQDVQADSDLDDDDVTTVTNGSGQDRDLEDQDPIGDFIGSDPDIEEAPDIPDEFDPDADFTYQEDTVPTGDIFASLDEPTFQDVEAPDEIPDLDTDPENEAIFSKEKPKKKASSQDTENKDFEDAFGTSDSIVETFSKEPATEEKTSTETPSTEEKKETGDPLVEGEHFEKRHDASHPQERQRITVRNQTMKRKSGLPATIPNKYLPKIKAKASSIYHWFDSRVLVVARGLTGDALKAAYEERMTLILQKYFGGNLPGQKLNPGIQKNEHTEDQIELFASMYADVKYAFQQYVRPAYSAVAPKGAAYTKSAIDILYDSKRKQKKDGTYAEGRGTQAAPRELELPETVLMAITESLLQFLKNDAASFVNPDAGMVKRMLYGNQNAALTADEFDAMGKTGAIPVTYIARSLGQTIAGRLRLTQEKFEKNHNLKNDPEAAKEYEALVKFLRERETLFNMDELEASLGAMAVEIGSHITVETEEESDVPTNLFYMASYKWTFEEGFKKSRRYNNTTDETGETEAHRTEVVFISSMERKDGTRYLHPGWANHSPMLTAGFDDFANSLHARIINTNSYYTTPVPEDNLMTKAKKSLFDLPKRIWTFMANKSAQPWVMDTGMGNLFLGMDDKTRLFLTDHKDLSKSPAKYLENDKAGYQAKERNLQQIKDFFMRHLGATYKTPVYFQYSPQNQHRIFMRSATINMQSSKEHRELFLAMDQAHYKKTGEMRPHMTTVNDERSLNLFKAAILEGFDKDPDKQNIDSLQTTFDQLLDDKNVQEILPLVQKMKNLSTTPVSESDQAKYNQLLRDLQSTHKSFFPLLTALSGLAEYVANEGKSFETTIILEADGKTNGGMFGKFQFYPGDPAGNMTTQEEHLENLSKIRAGMRRGGIVFKKDTQSHDRLATSPGFLDEYQTLARHFVRMAQRLIASNGASDEKHKVSSASHEDELKGRLWGAFKDYKKILGAKSLNILSSPMTIDGNISKFARNLAKPINMKGAYTAGIPTLSLETAIDTVEEIYRNLAAFQSQYSTLKELPDSEEEIARLVQEIKKYSLAIHQLLQVANTDKEGMPSYKIVEGEIIFNTHNARLLTETVLPLNDKNIKRKLDGKLAVSKGVTPNYQTADLNFAVDKLENSSEYTSIDKMIRDRVQAVYVSYITTAVENEYADMYSKRDTFLDGYDWMMSLFQVDLDIRIKNYMKKHGITKRTSLTEEEITRLIRQSKTYPSFPLSASSQEERDASREGNTLPSNDRIDMVKHGRSEGAPVSSAIKKKALPLAEGDTIYPENTVDVSNITVASSNKIMMSPGGSGVVRNIHSEDAFTVLVPLEDHDALILYDATKGTISQVEDINRIYNETFLGVNQDFKFLREMQKELQSRIDYMQNTVFGPGRENDFKKYMLDVRKHYAQYAQRGLKPGSETDFEKLFKEAMLEGDAPALMTGHAGGARGNYMDQVKHQADYVDLIDEEIFGSIDTERTKQMFLPDMTKEDDQRNNQTFEERRDPKTQSSVEEYAEEQTSLIYETTGTRQSIMAIFDKLRESATHTFSRTSATDMEDEVNNHLSMVLDTIIGTASDTLEELKISVKEGLHYAAGHYSPAAHSMTAAYSTTMNKAYVHQSPQEVYIHELLHAVTTRALNALPAYQRKMEKIYNHLKANNAISYKMFLNYDTKGNIIYLTDEATEIQVAKLLFAQVFSDRQDPSKAWNELLTYAVTNRNFYKSLENLPPLQDKWFEGKGLADGIFNFFHKLMSEFKRYVLRNENLPPNMAAQVMGISHDLMEISENKKGDVYEQYKLEGYRKYLETGNSGVRKFFKRHVHYNVMKVADWTLEKSFDTSEKMANSSQLGTTFFGAVGMMAFPFTRSAYIHAQDLAGNNAAIMDRLFAASNRNKVLKAAYNGMYAVTYSFRKKPTQYSQLRDRSNQLIDQLQQEAFEGGTTHLMQSFKQGYENLSEAAKHGITTTLLRTDIQSLVGKFTPTDLLDLIESAPSRQMYIRSLMRDLNIQKGSPVYTQFEQMAGAMITGKTHYTNIARNVETVDKWHNFADGSENKLQKADMLVSLIALGRTPTESRKQTAEVMRKEMSLDAENNGFTAMLQTARDITRKSRQELFKENPLSYEKGYIPMRQKGSTDLVLAPKSDKILMEKKGFQYVSEVSKVHVGGNNVQYAIFMKKDVPDIKRVRQIFSLKNSKRKGTSVSDIIYRNQSDSSPYQMHKTLDNFTRQQERLENRFSKEPTVRPIVNRQGKIIDYTVHMPTAAKESLLQQDLDPAALIATMYSAHSTKKNTPKVNSMLISLMHERYTQLKDKRPSAYWIDIMDPKNRDEYFHILPKETQQMVKSLSFEEDSEVPHFYIERPYVNLFYGYSEMSIANAWKIQDTRSVQNYLRKFEDFMADFANVVSSNIVVRTPAVSIDNALANFNTQVTLGIPITYILKSQHNVLNELTAYVDFSREKQKLIWQQRSSSSVDPKRERRITWLDRRLQASFIHPFMEEGIYNALTEDLDISNKAYRNKLLQTLSEKWEDKIGEDTLAGKLTREAFMTSTTQSYKEALFALRAGDIMAKISTYQWFTDHEKWSHNDAWELTDETFVNYNVATDKYSQYLARMGGVYFIKYWFGAQRAAWNLLKMKPLSVTMSLAAKTFLDLPMKTLVNSSWIGGRILPSSVFSMDIFKEVLTPPGLELLKPSNLNSLSGAAVAGFAGMQTADYLKNQKPPAK